MTWIADDCIISNPKLAHSDLHPRHSQSQIHRPLLTFSDPFLQLSFIPDLEPDLESLRLSRQACWNGIALQRVQDRIVTRVFRRQNVEGREESYEGSVEFAIGQMRARTHA